MMLSMVVVYRQSRLLTEAIKFFDIQDPTNIPFVNTTLGEVSSLGWQSIDNNVKFYIPQNWSQLNESGSFAVYSDITEILLDKEELIIFTELMSLPLKIPTINDINPKTVYVSEENEISLGYGFSSIKEFLTCKDKVHSFDGLEIFNYDLDNLAGTVTATSGKSLYYVGAVPVLSGPATVDETSELLGDSKVYGPCIVVNSIISNSTIYPGSVIVDSNVSESVVEGSYIQKSKLKNSSVTESSVYGSTINELGVQNSKIPSGTYLDGRNEEKRFR